MIVPFQPDNYKPTATIIANRFGDDAGEKIAVSNITIPPLGDILELARDDNFSLFIPKHRKIAGHLINIYLGKQHVYIYKCFYLYSLFIKIK